MTTPLNPFQSLINARPVPYRPGPRKRQGGTWLKAPPRPQVRPVVLACLRTSDVPLTTREIMARTGLTYLQVINAIRAMRAGDRVERVQGSRPPTYRATL